MVKVGFHAVRFFGNLAADRTQFFCLKRILWQGEAPREAKNVVTAGALPTLAGIAIIIIAFPAAGKKYYPNGWTTQKTDAKASVFCAHTRIFSSIKGKWC
ncbi:MAG: hypothetical protein HDR32_10905 [Treponema sp.]|nr:hypothetical protein [Treponema sp.]